MSVVTCRFGQDLHSLPGIVTWKAQDRGRDDGTASQGTVQAGLASICRRQVCQDGFGCRASCHKLLELTTTVIT